MWWKWKVAERAEALEATPWRQGGIEMTINNDDPRMAAISAFIKQAFALPAVKAAVLDVEAAALCQEIDNWLAASVAEEEQQHG